MLGVEQLDMVISALSGHNAHSNSAVSTVFAVSTEENEWVTETELSSTSGQMLGRLQFRCYIALTVHLWRDDCILWSYQSASFFKQENIIHTTSFSGEILAFWSKCYSNLIIALGVKDYLELLQNGTHNDSKNTIRTWNVCSLSTTDMLLANPSIPLHSNFASKGDNFNKNSDGEPWTCTFRNSTQAKTD